MKALLRPLLLLVGSSLGSSAPPSSPWLDASLPIPQRVSLLMDAMTLTERARQTYAFHDIPKFTGALKADLGATSFGSLKLSGVATQLAGEQVALRNELQAFVLNASRLSIPLSWHNEILVSAAPQATQFPLPVTLGASWNDSLLERVHEVLAAETRATGADVGYAPEVNMYVDARFGRLQEGFSEDPLLTSRLGVAAVRGLQGDGGSGPGTPLPAGRVAALGKHFVAYGKAAGGQNVGATDVSERTLREVYLAPWRAMLGPAAGLRGLMPSHQTIFDVPVHGNAWVGQTLLRRELNWSAGLSVSDCSDVGALISWGLAANGTHAAALGLEASVDMDNMCSTNADGKWSYQHLEEAVAAGLTTERRVNESCARVLSQKFAAGLFEDPLTHSTNASLAALLDRPAHRRLALEAAEQGLVLLLNRNGTLPLEAGAAAAADRVAQGGIALVGESASCTFDGGGGGGGGVAAASGGKPDPFHCAAQLNQLGKPQHNTGNVSVITVAQAIAVANANAMNANANSAAPLPLSGTLLGAHIDGPTPEADKAAAVALAARSGLAVLVLGDSVKSCAEWGDRSALTLPADQVLTSAFSFFYLLTTHSLLVSLLSLLYLLVVAAARGPAGAAAARARDRCPRCAAARARPPGLLRHRPLRQRARVLVAARLPEPGGRGRGVARRRGGRHGAGEPAARRDGHGRRGSLGPPRAGVAALRGTGGRPCLAVVPAAQRQVDREPPRRGRPHRRALPLRSVRRRPLDSTLRVRQRPLVLARR